MIQRRNILGWEGDSLKKRPNFHFPKVWIEVLEIFKGYKKRSKVSDKTLLKGAINTYYIQYKRKFKEEYKKLWYIPLSISITFIIIFASNYFLNNETYRYFYDFFLLTISIFLGSFISLRLNQYLEVKDDFRHFIEDHLENSKEAFTFLGNINEKWEKEFARQEKIKVDKFLKELEEILT